MITTKTYCIAVMFKLVSTTLAIYSFVGMGLIVFSDWESKPILNLLSYLLVFVIIPMYGAYGVWTKSKKVLLLALLLFSLQSIRGIGGDLWFPYSPPISLGIPVGGFTDGKGYLIDFFAITMTIFLFGLLRSSHYTKEKL